MTKGIFIGKFLPLHRGHLTAILESSTQCDHLYVVVSQNREFMKERCTAHNIKEMPLETVTMWLNIELKDFRDHITVVPVDETGIAPYPDGWPQWAGLARQALVKAGVEEKGWAHNSNKAIDIDYMFGSEQNYEDFGKMYFNANVKYIEIDFDRKYVDISATRLVKDIYTNWDMLPGSVREHFVKKVLITGTESCGKTTVVRKLAKNYLTSWSEEFGKYYEEKFLGAYSGNWHVNDFEKIAISQELQNHHAYKTANKVSFIDTDAVVTDFYLDMYLKQNSKLIEEMARKEVDQWDLVIMLEPTVKWVQDGTRWNSEDKVRWELHKKLCKMYDDLGIKYISIGGNYHYRFNKIRNLVDEMLKGVTSP